MYVLKGKLLDTQTYCIREARGVGEQHASCDRLVGLAAIEHLDLVNFWEILAGWLI